MSIQTDLTRITNAKSAIKAAIEGKGVTVPAGTLLDGMAPLIESIEAGGGDLTIDGRPVAWGIITPVENITSGITLVSRNDSPWLNVGTSASPSRLASGFITRIPSTRRPTFATLAIGASGPSFWSNGANGIVGSVSYFNSSGTIYETKSANLIELYYGELKLNPSTTYPLVAGDSYFWLAVQTVIPEAIT